MPKPSQIIVPLAWTPRSLAAVRVAHVLSAKLAVPTHLVSVIRSDAEGAERHQQLTSLAEEHGLENARVTVPVAAADEPSVADPDGPLMLMVRQNPDALFCLATHARGAIADVLLGSVASEVLHHAKRPMVMTGPQFSADWQGPVETLMVCLDGSDIAERILAPAAELALQTGARLMLVQVLDPHSGNAVLNADVAESGYLQSQAADLRKTYHLSADWDVLHGADPAKAIAQYVASFPNAMVAMTTHGRTGLEKLEYGSVMRNLLHRVHCPVLVQKTA
ncbi:MAG: universal stress protein [Saccharospirillum sp.]